MAAVLFKQRAEMMMSGSRVFAKAMIISFAAHLVIGGAFGGWFRFFKSTAAEDVKTTAVDLADDFPAPLPQIYILGKELNPEMNSKSSPDIIPEMPSRFDSAVMPDLLSQTRLIDEAQEAILRYQDTVKQSIESCRRYPAWARQRRIQGSVDLRFTILAGGQSRNITIIKSSGSALLDHEALETIRRAAPFRPLPGEIRQDSVNIRVAIVFALE